MPALSVFGPMWLVAMFDLPVLEPDQRRNYTRFRKALMKDGFMMLQYSVYARYLRSEESAEAHRKIVRSAVPPQGEVRLIAVTDYQFGKMEVYYGRKPRRPEKPQEQMLLF
ncbi:MAG: CRISPR-associated endonuclease Cas2 [Terriglobales bacterium]